MRWLTISAPQEYRSWLGELPAGAEIVTDAPAPVLAVHLFVSRQAQLRKYLAELRESLDPAGLIWVSWPKKASKAETDITEDAVRQAALPLGFVDVKVCAVSRVWSGLKLVIRRSEPSVRPTHAS